MSRNISELPFTEITERVGSLSRSPDNVNPKIRGVIQDVYLREITSKFDWNFLLASSSITTFQEEKTGNATMNTGDTTVLFSGAVIDSSMTGRKIKFSGNDVVYDFIFVNSTTGTIRPSFQGSSNASGSAFSIFQPIFTLASDFDRFPKGGGIYKWSGGKKEVLSEESYQEYSEKYESSPSTPKNIRLCSVDSLGCQQFEFRPAPNQARVYGYDYFRKQRPLMETSAGTITIVASAASVSGTNTKFTEACTGDYLRVNAFGTNDDSMWYRINNIGADNSLTLNTQFANSGVTNASYIISRAPEMPTKLHAAVLYGALRHLTLDQNDDSAIFYNQKMAEVLTDGKTLYVSRVYSQTVKTIAEEYTYRY